MESVSLSNTQYPRSKKSIDSYDVNDETVLHDRRGTDLLALNASGNAVWDLCDGSRSVSDIGRLLAERFEAPIDVLISDVRTTLMDWIERDLIELLEAPGKEKTDDEDSVIRVAFGSTQVQVRTDVEDVSAYVRKRFKAMLTTEHNRVVGQIGVSMLNGEYHVSGCEQLSLPESSIREVHKSIKHQIDRDLLEAHPNLIWLHAGAVASKKGALIMGGNFGAGKSTVISNLYTDGWTYLSDDIIPLDPVSGVAHPFPLTPMYRVNDGEYVDGLDVSNLKRIWVDLDTNSISRSPVDVIGFVFPSYEPTAETRLEALDPAAALIELVQHCMNFIHHGGEALRGLASLIENKRVFKLSYSDGPDAARVVAEEFGN